MSEPFDLVVIGSGPAGEKGATQAAYFGKRVAVVERRPDPGGAAATNAGVPSKALRETALYITGFRQREVYGVSLDISGDLALGHLTSRVDRTIATTVDAVRANIARHGIELVQGAGSLRPGPQVVVSAQGQPDRVLDSDFVLISTGSRPHHPPSVPFDDPDVHDSDDIVHLDRMPKSMVVIGGGAVACEYASIFTALGVDVTLVVDHSHVLTFLDTEISRLLGRIFESMGMRLLLGSRVAMVERDAGALRLTLDNGIVFGSEKVLFAAGRAGNTEGLGLGEAGVATDARGRILVDSSYRTTVPGIYAAGDVIGPPALASVSFEQGRVAVCRAFGFPFKEMVDPLPPFGVYSIPEVAMVGMSEQAARSRGLDFEVGRAWFAQNSRARIAGATEGLIKLVFLRDDRRLLGVHILGDEASELIHLGQAVLHEGGTIDRFIDTTFNVPTRSEAYKYAAYDGLQRLSPR